MPKFNVDVPNPLGKEEALNRLQGFSDKLREKYQDQISDLEQSWEGDRLDFAFKTFGIKIAGALTVEQEKVLVEGNLPFSAAMFKGKITSGIEEQLGKLLS